MSLSDRDEQSHGVARSRVAAHAQGRSVCKMEGTGNERLCPAPDQTSTREDEGSTHILYWIMSLCSGVDSCAGTLYEMTMSRSRLLRALGEQVSEPLIDWPLYTVNASCV